MDIGWNVASYQSDNGQRRDRSIRDFKERERQTSIFDLRPPNFYEEVNRFFICASNLFSYVNRKDLQSCLNLHDDATVFLWCLLTLPC